MENLVFSASVLRYSYTGTQPLTLEFQSLTLTKGETVLLKGSSGSGKTTLLRLIENSLTRDECTIEIDSTASLIYQDLRLVSEKTVLENILMGALFEIPKFSTNFKPEQIAKATKLCTAVGLLDQKDKLVSELSGGQRQRVAIVRTLMSSPKILLADECFSQIDAETAIETFKLIKALQKEFQFALVLSQHATLISENEFDKIITVNKAPSSNSIVSPKRHFEIFLGVLFFSLTVYALLTLDTMGFNSNLALQNTVDLLKQFANISSQTLQQTNWSNLATSFGVTLKMALLGTLFGFLIAAPLGFLATQELSNKGIAHFFRFSLMSLRTLPSIIWALLFVAALGIGSVAGVFALAFYSAGYLGKLVYETLEDLEQKSFLALRSLGASRYQAFKLSLLPQARPHLVAHFVFMLEYNIRAASVLGLVGAGGIGQDLMYNLEWRRFPQAGLILILLLAVIVLTDRFSNRLRQKLLRARGF